MMRIRFLIIFMVTISAMTFASAACAEQIHFTLIQGPGEVKIYVQNARDLGAFEIELNSNSKAFAVTRVQKGDLLQAAFRDFTLLGPKVDNAGKVSFGFFSLGYDEGISGGGIVAAIGVQGDPLTLKITNAKATDTQGRKLPCRY